MTRFGSILAALALMVSGAGCAAYRPLVDLRGGQTLYQYEADLAACQAYARQVSVADQALVGAALGAGLGAALGAVLGNAGQGAALGAIAGGARGLARGGESQIQVIQRCMQGRQWSVLN